MSLTKQTNVVISSKVTEIEARMTSDREKDEMRTIHYSTFVWVGLLVIFALIIMALFQIDPHAYPLAVTGISLSTGFGLALAKLFKKGGTPL